MERRVWTCGSQRAEETESISSENISPWRPWYWQKTQSILWFRLKWFTLVSSAPATKTAMTSSLINLLINPSCHIYDAPEGRAVCISVSLSCQHTRLSIDWLAFNMLIAIVSQRPRSLLIPFDRSLRSKPWCIDRFENNLQRTKMVKNIIIIIMVI